MAAPKITLRKVADLKRDPRNARTHSPEQIEQLAGSIGRFGFTVPGYHDEHDVVRIGNGGKAIPVGTIPIMDGSGYTEEDWKAVALGDNQLALNAGWNMDELTAQLDELSAGNFDIETIGFDQAALDALAAGDGQDAGGVRRGPGDGELEDSDFNHVDQFGIIIRCDDAVQQEARFNRLRDEFGPDNVKVVVV
jgi:ParB-like chromosome segregation protein Spo0J